MLPKPRTEKECCHWIAERSEAIHASESIGYVVRGLNERGIRTAADKAFTFAYAGTLHAHEAIVDPHVSHAVQSILDRRKLKHRRAASGKYFLSGLVQCSRCGNRMNGVERKNRGK